MRVEVIGQDLPYVGKLGTRHDIIDGQARVLIAIGRVKKVSAKKVKPPPEPEPEPEKPTRRKRYRRRDMRPERQSEE